MEFLRSDLSSLLSITKKIGDPDIMIHLPRLNKIEFQSVSDVKMTILVEIGVLVKCIPQYVSCIQIIRKYMDSFSP